jgi:dihydroorotase-like cyclic amidohydrolase
MSTSTYLIRNAKIVNEGVVFEGDILIENEFIKEIAEKISVKSSDCVIIDAEGSYVIPGAIDDQVHFREPGLTHKGDIYTESRAAVAGGITSFMEMPNNPTPPIDDKSYQEKKELIKKQLPVSIEFNSILLLEDNKIFFKSTAALKITKHLDGFWPILFILIIIPGFIRDYFYDVIATNRIKWFGKAASCWVEKDYKERFLS